MIFIALILPAFAVASPWLLAAGAVLAGVPVLIHLLRRRQYETRPWAAMQFLRRAARKRSRRARLEALLLLAMRVLIILFVATALARPFVTATPGAGGTDAAVQHVIVIDTSLSMGRASGPADRFEHAVQDAYAVVEAADVGDAFHLVRIGVAGPFRLIERPAYDAADVRGEISRLERTDERGDPAAALAEVLPLLQSDSEFTAREVYLLTDLQAANWSPDSPAERRRLQDLLAEIAAHARVTVVDGGGSAADNAAVIDLQAGRRTTTEDPSTELVATLRNFGETPRPDQRIELSVDGVFRDAQVLDLPPDGDVAARWTVPVAFESQTVVEVRLASSQPDADDARWLVLPPAERHRVLLVAGEPPPSSALPSAAGFAELALQPWAADDSAGRSRRVLPAPAVIEDGRLADVSLNDFDCVILCNVALLTAREANLLERFVLRGGGLIIAPGEAVRPANYNDLLLAGDREISPARLLEVAGDADAPAEGFRFDPGPYAHPILAPFEGNDESGLLTTRIHHYWRVEPLSDPSVRVVLRYSSGDAAIVERRLGDGRVLLVTTSLDDNWGNWALWPSFVPMLHEMTRYAASGHEDRRQLVAGDSIVRRLPADSFTQAAVELIPPDGETARLRVQDAAVRQVVSPPLRRSGTYSLRIGGTQPLVENYAVNFPAEEADPRTLDRGRLRDLLPAEATFRHLAAWQPPTSPASGDRLSRTGLSGWFLTAALALLLIEQLTAWRFPYGIAALITLATFALTAQLIGSLTVAGLVTAAAGGLAAAAWRLRHAPSAGSGLFAPARNR